MNYYKTDWLIIIITFIITLGAQAFINITYRKMRSIFPYIKKLLILN